MLMDKAAAQDAPDDALLDRIERALQDLDENADGPTEAGPSVAMKTTERSDDAASVAS